MFVNRKRELGFLRERARNKTGEFIAVYGKRRVGKTELVKPFWQTKPLRKSSFETWLKKLDFLTMTVSFSQDVSDT
ncbi:MAG: hypothetical protein HQM10_16175 [Candidatus Riflebacteria bacterium]|nr:hypothetical protein [Candidatus Riflebacteria bacterium]